MFPSISELVKTFIVSVLYSTPSRRTEYVLSLITVLRRFIPFFSDSISTSLSEYALVIIPFLVSFSFHF